jgi:hypothetical protein
MGSKNKGGREVRKAKKDKKVKGVAPSTSAIPASTSSAKNQPSKG